MRHRHEFCVTSLQCFTCAGASFHGVALALKNTACRTCRSAHEYIGPERGCVEMPCSTLSPMNAIHSRTIVRGCQFCPPASLSRPARSQGHHSQGGARLQRRRRLSGRQLHPARGLLEEAGRRIRPHEAGRHRQDRRGPAPVHGDHHLAREHQEARRTTRRSRSKLAHAEGLTEQQAHALAARRQGGRLDRRRPARQRDRWARSSSWRWSTRWSAAPIRRRCAS